MSGKKKLGNDEYRQDETLTNKVFELYDLISLKVS
jgi:hypothetical protein